MVPYGACLVDNRNEIQTLRGLVVCTLYKHPQIYTRYLFLSTLSNNVYVVEPKPELFSHLFFLALQVIFYEIDNAILKYDN